MHSLRRHFLKIGLGVVLLAGAAGYLVWPESTEPVARGFVLKQYVDSDGWQHNYLVFVPYDYAPGQKRPLLVFLNGFGHNGSDGLESIGANFGAPVWEMKRTFPFVVAIPQCRKNHSWIGGEGEKALAIAYEVAEDYGTDPDRMCLTGVSSGGAGTWYVAAKYADRFAAAVPLCGCPSSDVRSLVEAHLPIWNFCNNGDKKSLVESNRAMSRRLLEAGASPIVTEYPRRGHDCWNEGYRSIGMYDWLLEQSRSKNANRTGCFKLLASKDLLATWKTLGQAAWRSMEPYTLGLDESNEETSSGYLMSDESSANGAFHVEAWLPHQAGGCRVTLIEEAGKPLTEDSVKGYTLHVPFAWQGGGGLSHSSDGWIATLDPAAQRQLRPNWWNEVRLEFGDDRITVRVNGWKAIDVPVALESKVFRVALVADGGSKGTKWRNLRLRKPN